MAYQDNLSELFDLEKLRKQHAEAVGLVEDWLQKITDVSQKMRGLDMGMGNAKSISGLADVFKEADRLTKEQTENINRLSSAYLNLAKSKTENLKQGKLEAEIEREIRAEIEKTNKEKEKAEAKAKAEQNAYVQLSKAYREAANEAKRLYIEKGKDNAATQEAIKLAQQYHGELSAAEQAVGQYQRQVGNYNIVGQQFNQLLRELPNLAISPQTFLISLTNNISYFGEAVMHARMQGQSWGQVLSTIGGSMFGLIGILNIAILAVTTLGKEFLNSGNRAEEGMTKIQKAQQAALEDAKSLIEGIDLIDKKNNDAASTQKRQIDLMKAQGASSKELYEAQKKLRDLEEKDIKGQIQVYNDRQDAYVRFDKEINELNEKLKDLAAQRLIDEAEYNKAIKDANDKANKERLAAYEEALNLERALDDDLIKSKFENQKLYLEVDARDQQSILANEKATIDEKLAANTKLFEDKVELLKLEEYERLAANQKEFFDNKIRIDKLLVDEKTKNNLKLKNEREFQAEMQRIVNDYEVKKYDAAADMADKAIDLESKRKTIIDRGLVIAKQGIEDYHKWRREWQKREEKEDREALQQKMRNLQALRQAVQSVLSTINEVSQKNTERDLNRINIIREADDRKYQRERDNIMLSTIDNEEKQRKLADLDARADLRREQLAQREAQRKQRQAQFEKGLAILEATLSLYLGIAQEVKTKGAKGIVVGAAVAAYMATVISALSASDTPQYGDGTPEGGHPKTGAAIVGERYEAEKVTFPSGKSIIVDKPTYFANMPKGTKVVPLSELAQQGNGAGVINGVPMLAMQYGDNTAVVNAVNGLRADLTAKPQINYHLTNGELRKTVKVNNTITTYLNANNG